MKTLLTLVSVMVLIAGNANASRSQIITMPDGTSMVCYYYNGGRMVECVKL